MAAYAYPSRADSIKERVKADQRYDRAHGIKEDSPADKKMDRKMGITDADEAQYGNRKEAKHVADNGKFIQNAISKPGQLHRDLNVPQGKSIPKEKLKAAASRPGKVGERARFAIQLAKMGDKKQKPSGK